MLDMDSSPAGPWKILWNIAGEFLRLGYMVSTGLEQIDLAWPPAMTPSMQRFLL